MPIKTPILTTVVRSSIQQLSSRNNDQLVSQSKSINQALKSKETEIKNLENMLLFPENTITNVHTDENLSIEEKSVNNDNVDKCD